MKSAGALLLLLAGLAAAPAEASGPPLFKFQSGSARLDDRYAPPLLDWTIRWLKEAGATRVRLQASADSVGSAAANLRLARRRALAVKRALVAGGIPPATIEIEVLGEGHGLVETTDNVAEPENRYVMVEILEIPPRLQGSSGRDPVSRGPTRFIPHSPP